MAWIDEIRHVVVLMLENQSFDRLLGFLRLDDPTQQIDGVTGDETIPAVFDDPSRLVRMHRATTPEAYVTDPCPGHQIEDMTVQIFGQTRVPVPPTPTMSGFVANYASQPGADKRPLGADRAAAIMECLDPGLVPVISTLAKSFVVCDHWFASVPGPTWPNRFFVHAATSNGLIDSPSNAEQIAGFLGSKFAMRTIYENLQDAGRTWAVYFGDHAQAFAIKSLHRHADTGFRRLETFAIDVAAGTLPNYSFLEPVYMDTLGNPASDQHPPNHLLDGERLIAWVYDTLRGNDALWRQSLLVLLYDEHGGFYDHVPPPAAVPPDDVSAAASPFAFDRLGVRVPAILASPWIRKGRVDHRVYDHTSLLATLKHLFGLPDFLTRRDAQASIFDELDFLEAPRVADDMPAALAALVPRKAAGEARSRGAPSDLQRSLLALRAALRLRGIKEAFPLGGSLDRRHEEPQGP
jgi:phospholipase C